MTKTAREYMENVYRALQINHENLRKFYEGERGALRLAREIGYGLNDFPVEQHNDVLTSSYSYLCVRFYNLKPPINAKEWIREMKNQIINKEE